MRTTFSELIAVISRNYANYGNYAAVQIVRENYKSLTNVNELKSCLDWVEGAIIDSPFNGGLHSTYRAILARIESLRSTNK